jgi:hypothetical protein
MTTEDLNKRFMSEFEALVEQEVQLNMEAATAWIIMSQLQLALRHPQNVGPTTQIIRQVIDEIIGKVCPAGSALFELAQMGFDSKYDVPRV